MGVGGGGRKGSELSIILSINIKHISIIHGLPIADLRKQKITSGMIVIDNTKCTNIKHPF